ncbi:uncharacterized protein LOC100837108 [Brachypodium distachyon]|uniref:DNA-directed RNA polymerase III subunit RPC9 n=1 Tax=Brachypodium distachyon TaxID=15368 RepID=I1IIC5_BRADI|nr:uncharacterized protein LOC100837108 [Brachypodium distachyon]KQJ86695.1 hypothetical protein BRADI_4g07190v3 [Brachypodium distachyon]|eukprot:XP_003576296.1 uncharacterized protein LOC100837108 [Brachypodium distachyon]
MKIEKASAGHLTNLEVLQFLRSRGATVDPMGCLGAVAASECKVYEYLLKTPACNQTRESVTEFVKRCEGFKLTDADKQNVINWRPSSAADVYAMVEECGKRFSKDEQGGTTNEDKRVEELLNLINEIFPPPPTEPEDGVNVDMKDDEAAGAGETNDGVNVDMKDDEVAGAGETNDGVIVDMKDDEAAGVGETNDGVNVDMKVDYATAVGVMSTSKDP